MEITPSGAKATTTEYSKSAYRLEIDGLRALAVVAVIINHFNKNLLPSGYLGVDIFFVISGFVITSSLAKRQGKNFGDFLLGFYTRRIKRLVPALVLCVFITSILICLFSPTPESSLQTGMTSLFGLSNLYLLRQSTDYFATSTELNVFTHTWSLGVEEQFYFFFPFMVWFTGFGRLATKGSKNLFWVTGVLCVASVVIFIYLSKINQPAAYFLMPARLWELGTGCLVFLGLKSNTRLFGAIKNLPPLAVIVAVIAVLFIPIQFKVQATIVVVLLTGLLIASLRAETAGYKLLTCPQVVYIGLISYSLYLWHWSVLSISRWTIGIHWWSVPIQVALMLLLAVVSYRYVETPLRRSEWSSVRWKTIGYGLGACAIAVGFLIGLGKPLKGHLYTGATNQLEERYGRNSSATVAICDIFDNKVGSIEIARKCGFDSHYGHPTIYLVGDSHINQFSNSISSYAISKKMNFRGVWGGSCLFPAAVVPVNNVKCYKLQRQVEKSLIEKVEKGDIVFIGNALYARFSGYWSDDEVYTGPNGNSLAIGDAAELYSQRLREFADALVAKGAKVVVYLDSAQFYGLGSGGGICESQWFRPFPSKDCFIDSSVYLDRRNKDFWWVFDWADGVNKFAWDGIDSTTCSDGICRATHYADSNHFKEYYANYIFSLFIQKHSTLLTPQDKGI